MKEVKQIHYMAYYKNINHWWMSTGPLCETAPWQAETIQNPDEEVTCLKCQEMMARRVVEEL